MALAYRAGAPLKDMEFVQYHPTGLPFTGILITEAARGGYYSTRMGIGTCRTTTWERHKPSRSCVAWNSVREIASRKRSSKNRRDRTLEGPYGAVVSLDLRHLGEERLIRSCPLSGNYVLSTKTSIRSHT